MAGEQVEALRALVRMHKGDAAAAVREFSGLETQELADRILHPRQSVEQCLHESDGRQLAHVRRALEPELGLAPFDLDKVLG